ncbi:leucine-rich repeat protein [Artemisia annua]|uniref:Leucine-rich repeat protein n=1 Tax=Artemisia annua TaxID=35608 RepID=A0A2U1LM07_ARTAN|nr:leucine-rich repeat protein [Artemisia annua]
MDGERQALLEFKHGLIDEADRLASWVGEESDCCNWVGIVCDNYTGHVSQIHLAALEGHCDTLDYGTEKEYEEGSRQRLKGNLNSSLLHLKQLRHLDLSCNDFGGINVPNFIGSLGNLRYLNLSTSQFGGTIPPQLGNLTNLQVLCLGSFLENSYYESTILNMQWWSSLRRLHHLEMSRVDLSKETAWHQVINTLPSLATLGMSECQLLYINPRVARLNVTSLSFLDLSNNNFNSSVPRWIFSATSLVSLDLSGCNLHGPIPSSVATFHNFTSLQLLHVSENDFMNSSIVLEELSSISGNLISLDMSYCGVSSLVLNSLHNLTSVIRLDLSGNQLTKGITKLLLNICNLKQIDLSRNDFRNMSLTNLLENLFKCKKPALESLVLSTSGLSGHLPSQLGQLEHLEHLELYSNHIAGTIPDSIGRLSRLQTLDLSDNLIFDPIPYSIGQLSSLEVLRIYSNLVNGSLPDSVVKLSHLKELVISNNSLIGSLPESIGRLSLLKRMDLSYNKLSGSLPNSLGQLSKLEEVRFSSNFLSGAMTETHFVKLVSLKDLFGGGNKLTLRPRLVNWIPSFQLWRLNLNSWGLGPQFPFWLQSQKDLVLLDISNTGIYSPMPPDSFWRLLPSLNFLVMSHNHIRGTLSSIPATLSLLDLTKHLRCHVLHYLHYFLNGTFQPTFDLSNNSFEGSLHHVLCSYGEKDIKVLNLGNNHLSGVIPECWEKWPTLKFLNLEKNNLSGGIPRTLGSLSMLQSLNMGGNKLSGRLPASLVNLTKLNIIQLSGNELNGSIPTWLGRELSFLRLVNLKSNSFDGNIPHEICHLTHIQILELSDNNLSGPIPSCLNNYTVLSGKETVVNALYRTYSFDTSTEVIASDSLVRKGREDKYSTILPQVLLLDFSNNDLSGSIPSELTALSALQSLNLSRNQLTGRIPEKIGGMKALESFDLSVNRLSGELPMSLSNLNFLSNFNVSCNSLTGRIPSSTQLQSLTESSFFGNNLCGDPLTNRCTSVEVTDTKDHKEDDRSDGADWALIISIVLGFVVGFWVIVAPLLLSRSWRIAYFRIMSELKYLIYDAMHKYCFSMFAK